MPLRDHFHSPLQDDIPWESFHAQWPPTIVAELNAVLPDRYIAGARVRLGTSFEIDVAALDLDGREGSSAALGRVDSGNIGATAVWAPPQPTLAIATELPDQDEFEVRIVDALHRRRVLAAIEFVSPANKDRRENRQAFTAKCAALVRRGITVAIVDVVTTRQFNLYSELLEMLGHADPALLPVPPSLYAVACRWHRAGDAGRWEAWAYPLALGKQLPTLTLWLGQDMVIPLDLESSYEQTCRALRIN